MRNLIAIGMLCASSVAHCEPYRDFPAPDPYPFQRSLLTGERVVIPPYDHAFAVRVYNTPQHEPYYNVPPYAVVVP